jgi:hypothetical protein
MRAVPRRWRRSTRLLTLLLEEPATNHRDDGAALPGRRAPPRSGVGCGSLLCLGRLCCKQIGLQQVSAKPLAAGGQAPRRLLAALTTLWSTACRHPN